MKTAMKVSPTTPGRGFLFTGLTLVMPLLAAQTAIAQTDAERLEALRACLAIESDAARLLCFESIVSAEPADREPPGGRTAATATDEGVESAVEAVPEAPTASAPADVAGDPVAAEPEPTRPATAEPATDEARASDVAREQRRDRDQAREEEAAETILVVEAGRGYRGNAIFVTDAGRSFLQTSGNTARVLPEAPFEATLEDGAFGSVFLVARSAGLRVRVREQTE